MLLRVDGPSGHRNFSLEPGAAALVAGRGTDADIRLPDAQRSISRRHLSFRLDLEGVRVEVVSDALGALSSRGELAPHSVCWLHPGDHLTLGEYRLTIALPESRNQAAEAGAGTAAEAGAPPAPADDDLLALIAPKDLATAPHLPGGQAYQVLPASVPASLLAPGSVPGSAPARMLEPISDQGAVWPGREAVDALLRPADDAQTPAGDLALDSIEQFLAARPADSRPADGHDHALEQPLRIVTAAPQPQDDWSQLATPTEAADDIWAHLVALAGGAAPETPSAAPQAACAAASNSGTAPAPTACGELADILGALSDGLGAPVPGSLGLEDWRHLGATLKALVQGYERLLSARDGVRSTLGVPGRTEMFNHDNNPLKLRVSLAEKVQLLAWGQGDARRYRPAQTAIAQATHDLMVHDRAIIAACRVSMEEVVHSFNPQRWMTEDGRVKRLPVLGEAQLWRRYCEHYEKQGEHMADWLQRLFDEHFVNAYARESDVPWREQLT